MVGLGGIFPGQRLAGTEDDAVNEDAGGDDGFGVEVTEFDDVVDLGDRDVRGAGHGGVEGAAGAVVDEVAAAVGLVGANDGEVGVEGGFEDVRNAVEVADLFAVGGDGADADGGVERGDPSAGAADAFGEVALADEFDFGDAFADFDFGRPLHGARGGGEGEDAFADLAAFKKCANVPKVVGKVDKAAHALADDGEAGDAHAAEVAGDGEVGDAFAHEGGDEIAGVLAGAGEAAAVEHCAVGYIGDGLVKAVDDLVDHGGLPDGGFPDGGLPDRQVRWVGPGMQHSEGFVRSAMM